MIFLSHTPKLHFNIYHFVLSCSIEVLFTLINESLGFNTTKMVHTQKNRNNYNQLTHTQRCKPATIKYLTHRGRVTHICVSRLTIISSDNGLPPGRRQAILWTNAGILLIGALEINVSEILIEICTFSWKKMLFKMSCGKMRPSCIGLNVLSENCSPIGPKACGNVPFNYIG